jgi:hypothetical protein
MSIVRNQITGLIDNKMLSTEQLKEIEPIMRENCNTCVKQFYKFYFLIIISSILWFLINNSIIDKITVLDINISNKTILLLSVPFISIISAYIANSYFAYYQLIDNALKRIYINIFPSISKTIFPHFLEFPSFISLESMKASIKNESFFSMLNLILMMIILNILPLLINGYISIKLLIIFWKTWYVVLPIIYLLLIFKVFSDFIFYFKQAQ